MFEYKANFFKCVNISASLKSYVTARLGLYSNVICFVVHKDGSLRPSSIPMQDIKNKISNFVV